MKSTKQCLYYWWEEFMKYAVEIASGGMMYMPSFVKNGSDVQKLLGWDTHAQQGDLICLLLFF